MKNIREPIQERSRIKKEKILKAGFELFCEKGYHGTNTIEIAKRADVSVGAVYSYFSDKRNIYIEAFEEYLRSYSERLFENLEAAQQPFQLSGFVENWITYYIDLYATSSHAFLQLKMMRLEDEEISRQFNDFENKYFSKIVEILQKNNINSNHLFEKVYSSCILIDGLNAENSSFPHEIFDFRILKVQVKETIIDLLKD